MGNLFSAVFQPHPIVTGASITLKPKDSRSPNRLDIYDLVKDPVQFSLYVQAIAAMYAVDQSKATSYFQLAGIHGMPYEPWAGSRKGYEDGYCVHGTVLFPTWHRPYIALFEQALQRHAIDIAETYTVPDRDMWMRAAVNLRAPYWDWASVSVPPDEVLSMANVEITRYDGKRVQVSNPLFRYTFHPVYPGFPAPFDQWNTTKRALTNDKLDAKSNVELLKQELAKAQDQVKYSTYHLFMSRDDWAGFSTHAVLDGPPGAVSYKKRPRNSNSLESIHDTIHLYVFFFVSLLVIHQVTLLVSRLLGGHMADPAVAAFDPIFWLHHANIDRILSLWTAFNGGKWVHPKAENDTDLTPFWKSQKSHWTSAMVTTTDSLGYSYPEFNGVDINDLGAMRERAATVIHQLYSPSFAKIHEAEGQLPSDHPRDWTARIRFKKYQLGGSFSVLIFLGDVPDDPLEWRICSSFVGAYHALANSAAGRCANCRRQRDLVIEGFVHLSPTMAERSGFGALKAQQALPFLGQHLSWRLQRVNRSPINIDELPSLEVVIMSTPLDLDTFSTKQDDIRVHYCMTLGLPGGAVPSYRLKLK
ncbi:common central domain of tyrosinase-domain-containing protein [Amylostereum chailletii]|nr:common central domain of tyrosinase-domain-containing protein [Amylostereum chailletii]